MEVVDWEFAQDEIAAVTSKVPALGKQDEKLLAQMKQLEQDLEAQKAKTLLELEKQREAVAREASDEAKARFAETQKQLQEDNRKLEAQLNRTKAEEAERARKFLIESQLVKLLGMCDEANSIANEFHKDLEFSPKLLTMFNAVGKQFTEPGVKFTNYETGEVAVWDFEKFQTRLFLMRDLYTEFQDWVPSGDDEVFLIPAEEDPFFDPPNSQLIGRAQIHLQPLAFGIDFNDDVPFFDYQGTLRGKVHVKILPLALSGEEAPAVDDVTDNIGTTQMFRIEVQSAKDLPANLKPGFFCKYRFWDSPVSSTEPVDPFTRTPQWTHMQQVIQDINYDFLEYLQDGCLFVELFGELKVDEMHRPVRGMTPGTPQATGTPGSNPRNPALSRVGGRQKRAISISGLPPSLVHSLLDPNHTRAGSGTPATPQSMGEDGRGMHMTPLNLDAQLHVQMTTPEKEEEHRRLTARAAQADALEQEAERLRLIAARADVLEKEAEALRERASKAESQRAEAEKRAQEAQQQQQQGKTSKVEDTDKDKGDKGAKSAEEELKKRIAELEQAVKAKDREISELNQKIATTPKSKACAIM